MSTGISLVVFCDGNSLLINDVIKVLVILENASISLQEQILDLSGNYFGVMIKVA